MITCFKKSKSQKELFSQLNHSMIIESDEKTIKGVYIIFKNNVCVYVGQSSNVANRLATHLSGKYKNANEIFVFVPEYEEDLIITEKYCIQKLQPIENLRVDFDERISIDDIFAIFHDYEKGAYENMLEFYDFKIKNDDENIFITTDPNENVFNITKNNEYVFKRFTV